MRIAISVEDWFELIGNASFAVGYMRGGREGERVIADRLEKSVVKARENIKVIEVES